MSKHKESAELANTINRAFKSSFEPFGFDDGRNHTQYLSRWRAPNGVVIVAENTQPNIWMKQRDFDRASLVIEGIECDSFEPGKEKPGFHSNVAQTMGFHGQSVIKLRVQTFSDSQSVLKQLTEKLRAL